MCPLLMRMHAVRGPAPLRVGVNHSPERLIHRDQQRVKLAGKSRNAGVVPINDRVVRVLAQFADNGRLAKD